MARKPLRTDDGVEKGGFVKVPHVVLRSLGFSQLSAHATKLLMDLLSQFIGNNNGDLGAAYSVMKKRGWRSKGTLNRAIKELLEAGFIEVSRQGGKHKCSLYAVTFYKVDYCKGKLDISPTERPVSTWKKNEPLPDIATLQRQKQQREDAALAKAIIERVKRAAV
jgi:hypothetical protein